MSKCYVKAHPEALMLAEGRKDEEFVATLLEQECGGKCRKSTLREDKYKHIDLWWDSPKMGRLGIDVKGRGKNSRKDKEYSDNHWIEAKNVSGKKGWIYGSMNYIAFRTKDKVLFVKPECLIEIYENKLKDTPFTEDTPKECYVLYKRSKWGNDDLSWKMPNKDLEELAHFVISYKAPSTE